MIGIWENLKNNKKYMVTGLATDANNNGDGNSIVIYFDDMSRRFTRNANEFRDKFVPMLLLDGKRVRR